jgi:hypothetical protein
MKATPIDQELYDRTAPAWTCITEPGEGPHYLSGDGGCQWCGMTREAIRAERAARPAVTADPDVADVFSAGEALGLLRFNYATTPDPGGPTFYVFGWLAPEGTWSEARLVRRGVLQRWGSLPSRLDRLYEPHKLNEAGWPAVVCGDCGSGIIERRGRNWHRDGTPQCMGRADAALRKPPGHFGPDWPAPLTWRVRQPGGEVVGWGLTREAAERLADAWPDDLAEVDPAQVPSSLLYPEALS